MKYALVLVNIKGLGVKTFSYLIPPEMSGIIQIGQAVLVPFGRQGLINAFVVGLIQGLAVLPGISRSGSTISTLKFMGVKNNNATTYSFLLSVPIIIGGIVLEFFKNPSATQNIGIIPCLVGFAFAFVFGLFSLVILNKLIKNNKWWVFAPYLLILGVLISVWQYV